jgi:hypothetical protein
MMIPSLEVCGEKAARREPLRAAFSGCLLLGLGSANGAFALACAALDAQIGIDHILAVNLGDSLNGACVNASAASYACVGNLVGHGSYLLVN